MAVSRIVFDDSGYNDITCDVACDRGSARLICHSEDDLAIALKAMLPRYAPVSVYFDELRYMKVAADLARDYKLDVYEKAAKGEAG